MSHNTISMFFTIVVMLYAAANPIAHATLFQRNLRVTGRLCCVTDGNCVTNSTAVVGAVVSLNCPTNNIFGPATVVGQGTTNATGNFTITATIRSLLTLSQCSVTVPLPLTGAAAVSCPLLANATTATSLTSRLRLVSITGNIFGRVLNANVIRFVRA